MKSHVAQERTKFWIDPLLDNLELLQATYFTFTFTPHVHDTYAIGVTEAGAQTFTYQRTKQLIMPAGSIAVVHPGEMHTSRASDDQGWSYRMLYPNANILCQITSELAGASQDIPGFPSPVIADAALAWHIQKFHRALEDPTTTRLERESGLRWVLGMMILRHAAGRLPLHPAKPEPGYVRLICKYLEDHFAEPVGLEQLAQLANMSSFHVLRVFRRTLGLTPHVYQTHLRLEHAKHYLLQGMPLVQVAAETGFVDQSHFSRHFKRVVGISPGQYC